MRIIFLLLPCILIIGILGCNKDERPESEKLRDNPEEVQIDDLRLQLNTHLWRDTFDQGVTADLRSIVRLTEADSASIDNSAFKLIKQYVIRRSSTWEVTIKEVEQLLPYQIQGKSVDGPRWGPGIEVDVVLVFTYNGEEYKLLATGQKIHNGI